jgi:tRNA A37 N6-isopentenylltransferase MiaA
MSKNIEGQGFHTNPERINKNGRPKKFVSLMKEHGYKLSEINDTIQNMMAMNLDEIKEIFIDKESTILEKTIANAIKKSIDKGSLDSLETLITRVYGKPTEQSNMNIKSDNKIIVRFEPYNNGNNITETP